MCVYVYIYTHLLNLLFVNSIMMTMACRKNLPKKKSFFYDTAQSMSSHGGVSYKDNGDNTALSAVLLF